MRGGNEHSFWCRYSEISTFYELVQTDRNLDGVVFPGKGFFGLIDADERMVDLDSFFHSLSPQVNLISEKHQRVLRKFLRLQQEEGEEGRADEGAEREANGGGDGKMGLGDPIGRARRGDGGEGNGGDTSPAGLGVRPRGERRVRFED